MSGETNTHSETVSTTVAYVIMSGTVVIWASSFAGIRGLITDQY